MTELVYNFSSDTEYVIYQVSISGSPSDEWRVEESGFTDGVIETYNDYLYVPSSGMEGDTAYVDVFAKESSVPNQHVVFYYKNKGVEGDEPSDDYEFLTIEDVKRNEPSESTQWVSFYVNVNKVSEDYINDIRYWVKSNKAKLIEASIQVVYTEKTNLYDYKNFYKFDLTDIVDEVKECPSNFYAVDDHNRIHNIGIDLLNAQDGTTYYSFE